MAIVDRAPHPAEPCGTITSAVAGSERRDEVPIATDLRFSRFLPRLGRSMLALSDSQNVSSVLWILGAGGGAILLDDEVHLAFPSDDTHHGTPTRRFSTGRLVRELGEIGDIVGNMVAGLGVGYVVGQTVLRSNGLAAQKSRVVWTPVVGVNGVALSVGW